MGGSCFLILAGKEGGKKAIPFLVCSAQSSFAPGVVLANRAQHGYPCPGGFLWRAGIAGLGLAVLLLVLSLLEGVERLGD